MGLFHTLVALHIVTGATGAIAFWVPVIGRKGGVDHRRWGRVFTRSLLVTGTVAIAMSLLTLHDPIGTHPHLEGRFEPEFIRGIFGWMMLHNGILTLNLVWYGWLCVTNRRSHAENLEWRNLGLQAALTLAAIACAWDGYSIGQPLMMGLAVVGFATVGTNLFFLYKPRRAPQDWQKEHLKALVGAGISVYTAFLAFGSVRIVPELALNPLMWAVPLTTGIGIILYHWRKLDRAHARAAARLRAAA